MEPLPTMHEQTADFLSELEATNCLPPLARVSGEPCSEPDQAADDRARRRDYPCVAVNSTSKGFQFQCIDYCFFCLRWDTPAVPSFMHCLCFPTPLFVIAELVPMLELGMADPVQIHTVEAGILWLAASRNRFAASNFPGRVSSCSHGLWKEATSSVDLLQESACRLPSHDHDCHCRVHPFFGHQIRRPLGCEWA